MVRALFVTLIAAACAGCPIAVDGDSCAPGDDCGAGAVCTDLAVCASEESAPPWRISWTINGEAVSIERPGPCEGVDELALTVSAIDDMVSFRPVTCAIGQFDFTALPSRYDTVILELFTGDDRLDRRAGSRDGEVLSLDLEL